MEITQSLHNIFSIQNRESKIKTALLFWFLVLSSFATKAQDTIVPQQSVNEKTNLQFQESFFTALTEKGIKNYKKALNQLMECNSLIPKNKAVLFEISKNYFSLNQYTEAVIYGKLALEEAPKNRWLLQHIVAIYEKQADYQNAIFYQKKLAIINPKYQQKLVFLYLKNKDYTQVKKVLADLKSNKMLTPRLRAIFQSFSKAKTKKIITPKQQKPTITNFEEAFTTTKTYPNLKKLLHHLDAGNNPKFLEYSNTGVDLFPAQPFVYLMHGKALNKNQQFKKAIETLTNGIDFVIDNPELMTKFYKAFLQSYQGLGDQKNIEKYKRKLNS